MPVCEFSVAFPMGLRVLTTKLPCASKVKASPWPVLPELECWEGVWGQTRVTCTKYPKNSPMSAASLTGTQDCWKWDKGVYTYAASLLKRS